MQPSPPPGSIDTGFEAAVHAADRAVRDQNKRNRETEHAVRKRLRKPQADEFPFHALVDVLNGVLRAITELTEEQSPGFDLKTDPRAVFKWARDAILGFGTRCREEGAYLAQANAEPKLKPELQLQAIELMGRLDSLLKNSP